MLEFKFLILNGRGAARGVSRGVGASEERRFEPQSRDDGALDFFTRGNGGAGALGFRFKILRFLRISAFQAVA